MPSGTDGSGRTAKGRAARRKNWKHGDRPPHAPVGPPPLPDVLGLVYRLGLRGSGRARVGRGHQGGHGDDGRTERSGVTRGYVSVERGEASGHGNRPRNDSGGSSTFTCAPNVGGRRPDGKAVCTPGTASRCARRASCGRPAMVSAGGTGRRRHHETKRPVCAAQGNRRRGRVSSYLKIPIFRQDLPSCSTCMAMRFPMPTFRRGRSLQLIRAVVEPVRMVRGDARYMSPVLQACFALKSCCRRLC